MTNPYEDQAAMMNLLSRLDTMASAIQDLTRVLNRLPVEVDVNLSPGSPTVRARLLALTPDGAIVVVNRSIQLVPLGQCLVPEISRR